MVRRFASTLTVVSLLAVSASARAGSMDPATDRLVLQPNVGGTTMPNGTTCQQLAADPEIAVKAGTVPNNYPCRPDNARLREPRLGARLRPRADGVPPGAYDGLRRLRAHPRGELHEDQLGRLQHRRGRLDPAPVLARGNARRDRSDHRRLLGEEHQSRRRSSRSTRSRRARGSRSASRSRACSATSRTRPCGPSAPT